MNSKEKYHRQFALTALATSIICFNQSVFAMQALQDHDLRQVNAQDGVLIETEYSALAIDQLYWEDRAGTAADTERALRAVANDVKIGKNMSYDAGAGAGNYALGSSYQINTGSTATNTAGIDFLATMQPSTLSIKNFQLCAQTPVVNCNASLGNFALQTGSPLLFGITTRDGLFNKNSQSEMTIGLRNANVYVGLPTLVANQYNQLILRNSNFNFYGKGIAYVDEVEGFVLNSNIGAGKASKTQVPNSTYGYIDFIRVASPDQAGAASSTYYNGTVATGSGLNLEFMTKANAVVDPINPVYSLDTAKGLIRVGASGRMVNSFLKVRGTDASTLGLPNNVLGFASSAGQPSPTATGDNATVIGSSGIATRLRGEFTATGDSMLAGGGQTTTLEIGGAGADSYGFEFGELKPLVSNSSERAYFDSGNIYLNLADTKHLQMPENTVLKNSRFGGQTGSFLTKPGDYIQQIHKDNLNNPYSLVMAIRGAEFQALSKRGRFTSSAGVAPANAIAPTAGLNNQWGLGLPFYNLNVNMAMYTTKYTGDVFNYVGNMVTKSALSNVDRLGFALALSVDGRNADGSKTTSIMVIDGGDRDGNAGNGIQATDFYFGLRNVDMLLRGYGSVGFENGNFNMSMSDLLMVMSAELAAGYLPGSVYKSTGVAVPLNAFTSKDDVLLGLKIKLLGDMNVSLIANNQVADGSNLSVVGEYKLTDGTIQLSDPTSESMIGFDRMSGLVRFNNAIEINQDNVSFNYNFDFNPAGQTAAERAQNVFRVRDINLYPPVGAANNRGQRLGEMVLTGGRFASELSIRPRN